jgi:tRNA-Thr(GGU) m(6)t(6)A37 methyltransferase TsaA
MNAFNASNEKRIIKPILDLVLERKNMREISYSPIGTIKSPFKEPKGTPIQTSAAIGVEGIVEIFQEFADGLKDLEGFSHIILLYHFHLAKEASLQVKPFLDERNHGVFATRAPSRPNPIGISVVRLVNIEGNMLRIEDVDIVDGTPLLDIKPYVPEFDIQEVERKGWLDKKINKLATSRDDGRFRT